MLPLLFLSLLLSAAVPSSLARERYDGQQVLRVNPTTEAQMKFLRHLREEFTRALEIDWWAEPTRIGQNVDFRVKPHALPVVNRLMSEANMDPTVLIEDVETLVAAQLRAAEGVYGIAFDQYNKLDDINNWVLSLSHQYPQLATAIQVGTSYENRPIYAVKLTGRAAANKPAFWMDGCIHAREWIATATVLHMLNTLLSQYGKDNRITHIVDSLDIYVLPVFNVDGYEYTWTTDRMWRKTRSHNGHGVCVGVDPNRNWDFHWADGGASGNPCDDAYEGPKAFSEVEVRSVAGFLKNITGLNGYVNFHSFAQLWMSPWGYTAAKPSDYTIQEDLSGKAVAALAAVHGTQYQYGPIYTTIYPASGSSVDWTYGVADVVFSYGVELRDQGQYGFLLPASEIVPSGEETLAGILVAMEYVIAHPKAASPAVALA